MVHQEAIADSLEDASKKAYDYFLCLIKDEEINGSLEA